MRPVIEPRAAAQVCAIPELLEDILLNVHPIQLFTLQSINSTFHDLIQNTKSLRRHMCLEPSADRKSVADILEHKRIQDMTQPFSINLYHFGHHHISDYFDFELQCDFIQDEKYGQHVPPSREDFSCMGAGTWRQIKLSDPRGSSTFADISCEGFPILDRTAEVGPDSALGSVIEEAVDTARREWRQIYRCCRNAMWGGRFIGVAES